MLTSRVNNLIDQMFLETRSDATPVRLEEWANHVKTCVKGYSNPTLCYLIWNAIKSIFNMSDWQIATRDLQSSLVGRNIHLFLDLTHPPLISNKILEALVEINSAGTTDSDEALRKLKGRINEVYNTDFNLGQLSF